MIEHIQRIGKYYQEANPSITPIMGMVNQINSKDMKYLLLLDVQRDSVTYQLKDYREDVVNDALFYQSGNAMMGGGIRLDYYEDRKAKTPSKRFEKGRKKLRSICKFCEVEDRYPEIETLVEDFLRENDEKTFAVLQIDGRMPHEVFTDKFLKEMYQNTYKELAQPGRCHICGQRGKVFNNILFSFYTNDKDIYKNIDHKELTGYIIDEECLNHIILAKRYIDRYLSTYWGTIGENVMFLPHDYNEDTAWIFENTILEDEGKSINFIHTIRLNEEDFMDSIGKSKSFIDILFYETKSSAFYINYHIQSILPSRFTMIGNLLKEYSLTLPTILRYAATLYISLDNLESTKKEKIRIIDGIFSGKRLERNIFFKRVTEVFRFYYLRKEHKKYRCIDTINRIYNFLCQCGCLEGEWNVLKKQYKDYQEFFEVNKSYFNLNEKKAWFILGMAYNATIYYMRGQGDRQEGEVDRTSLEKNFFFAKKFDFKDFVYFANLIEEKLIKYRIDKLFLKKMLCEAKELMANRQNQLSLDEAKYIFFWGLDSYFGKSVSEEEDIKDEIKEGEVL